MSRFHCLAIVTAIVSFASNACATRDAQPSKAGPLVSCPGGTLRTSAEAARYRSCQVVQGDLTVSLGEAPDLQPLAGLKHVTGTLRVSNSPALDDLSGLDGLTSVGALEIRDNAGLDDLVGLAQLERAGRVDVSNNPGLQTLKGLDGLTETGRLEIRNNGLYNINGLGELRRVGDLVIEGNRKLNSLYGLRSIERARSVAISNNPALCGAGILPALTQVDGALVLRKNRGVSEREARLVLERAGHDGLSPVVTDGLVLVQSAQR